MNTKPFCLLLTLLALVGCGGAGQSPSSVDGVQEVVDFVVPAGTTQEVTQDLAVFASNSIEIDGTLHVAPGVSLTLISDGDLTINGAIQGSEEDPAQNTASLSFSSLFIGVAHAESSASWAFSGDGIAIAKNAVLKPGKDDDVQITTHDNAGKIYIDGTIQTPDGRDAKNRDENGQNAASIQIGTQMAIDNVKAAAKKFGKNIATDQPALLRVSGTLDAGNGGDGFNDLKGLEAGGKLSLHGTNGGDGGDIALAANQLELTGTITSGQGGDGGAAGDAAANGTHARDGAKDGDKGFDLDFVTGNGGRGGNIDISQGPIGAGQDVDYGTTARGGKAGSAYASAGNGAAWGAGGNTTGKIGDIGSNGYMNSHIGDSTEALKGSAILQNGGNGGDSNSSDHRGGSGGTMVITNPDGGMARLSSNIEFSNYGNGGNGYNGCAVNPHASGSGGGNSYNSPVVPLAVYGAPYTVSSRSFAGGRGGDGSPTFGLGGAGGFDDALKTVGEDGNNGKPCNDGHASLILDHPLGGEFVAGMSIDVTRLAGYRVQAADAGCDHTHIHAASSEGIAIDGQGPYFDPAPFGCGFGALSE